MEGKLLRDSFTRKGKDAVEFYTESKIVVERWSRQETRKF